jgi:hypothetical protein
MREDELMKRKTISPLFLLFICVTAMHVPALELKGSACLGVDSYGLPAQDATGVSFKYFFSENIGCQLFLSPQLMSEGIADLTAGLSPIINLRRTAGQGRRTDVIFFQLVPELSYRVQKEAGADVIRHTVTVIPTLGCEYFLSERISIGYRFGLGAALSWFPGSGDTGVKLDVKAPGNLNNLLLMIPVHFYLF